MPETQTAPEVNPVPPPAGATQRERGFAFRPEQIAAGPDWDFIFRYFVDYGKTFNNRAVSLAEQDRTLLSTGIGLEFQLFKPLFTSIRADWGIALATEDEFVNDPVEAGDSRFHFSATIAF